jgi:thioredoxin reductase (NADPH)
VEVLDLIVVGAGPSGLAVAIAAHQAGLTYEVLEKGVLVNSIYHFPAQMTFFTTPELLEIGGLPFVTPFEKPTRAEGLKYYRRVSETYSLRVRLGEEVRRLATRPGAADGAAFVVESRRGGESREWRALAHVSHYYDDPHPCWGRRVVVVGGKNSAAIAALELYRARASVTLVHRGRTLSDSIKYWIRPDIENRLKEGTIRGLFEACVREIRPGAVVVATAAGQEEIAADRVFLLTGYQPDTRLLLEAGVRVDAETLVPAHDPATLETNVAGLYVAGALVSGRHTSRIFIENGRFHGDTIVSAIARRSSGLSPAPAR